MREGNRAATGGCPCDPGPDSDTEFSNFELLNLQLLNVEPLNREQ